MRAREELVTRLAQRRAAKLGGLSEGGMRELVEAIRKDPQRFVDDASDEAFLRVAQALERHDAAALHDDLLDDDEFYQERMRRLARLEADCAQALALDEHCLDAALLAVLARDLDPDRLLAQLIELRESLPTTTSVAEGDPWDDVFARPALRLDAAIACSCLDTARYRMAAEACEALIERSPADALGARHTCALAYARLEDEPALEGLEARFGHQGSSWSHLARMLLLFKLGRIAAAKRALEGFARLCDGGAYALLRPILVDVYLPDRPETSTLSFEEATLAVHEADPIIVDVPDFIGWAQGLRTVYFAAEDFARKRDLDW